MARKKNNEVNKTNPNVGPADGPPMSDSDILTQIKDKIFKGLQKNTFKPKVSDLVKILELQKKLSTDKNAEDKFWQLIEEIRQEELKDAE